MTALKLAAKLDRESPATLANSSTVHECARSAWAARIAFSRRLSTKPANHPAPLAPCFAQKARRA
jgi:hypothetical protein